MNNGHFWTKMEEDAALMMGWPEFNRRFNGDSEEETISYNAYRFKRARLLNDDATSQTTSAVFINEYTWKPGTTEVREQFFEPGGYVGLTHGFFDIETTFSTQPRVLYAAVGDSWGNIKQFTRDMYPGEDKLFDDKELVEAYVKELQTFDILIGWNSKAFDVPVLNGRLAYHNSTIGRVDPKMHIDLMWYATGQFMKIGRRSLESVSSYFGTSNRKTPLDVRTWDRAVAGDDDAYRSIAEHCDADVLVLRDVFSTLKSHIRNVHR